MERPLGLGIGADELVKSGGGLPIRHGEAGGVPLEARVVVPDVGIHVLLVIEDASSPVVDEVGQVGGQAEPQRTVQQEANRAGYVRFVLRGAHALPIRPDRQETTLGDGLRRKGVASGLRSCRAPVRTPGRTWRILLPWSTKSVEDISLPARSLIEGR